MTEPSLARDAPIHVRRFGGHSYLTVKDTPSLEVVRRGRINVTTEIAWRQGSEPRMVLLSGEVVLRCDRGGAALHHGEKAQRCGRLILGSVRVVEIKAALMFGWRLVVRAIGVIEVKVTASHLVRHSLEVIEGVRDVERQSFEMKGFDAAVKDWSVDWSSDAFGILKFDFDCFDGALDVSIGDVDASSLDGSRAIGVLEVERAREVELGRKGDGRLSLRAFVPDQLINQAVLVCGLLRRWWQRLHGVVESSLQGVERARLGQEAAAIGQETFSAVEDTSVEEIDNGKLVERSETLVHIRCMMNWSFVIRVVELLEIVGQLVQSGGFLDVVGLEKLRGHSAVLTDLAEAVLAADAHTCGGVREVGDDRWR